MSKITKEMMTEVAPGVFYTDQSLVAVDDDVISLLKASATASPLKRARLCAHPNASALQQDMIIVSHQSTYVAPHRHLNKSESLLVLEGTADAITFDEDGEITDVLKMGSRDDGAIFFYRMPQNRFHSLLIKSDFLIFVESTIGPFDPAQSENAFWAPASDAEEAATYFKTQLEKRVTHFLAK
jgi:cupin fold WbuC family metalloprotein